MAHLSAARLSLLWALAVAVGPGEVRVERGEETRAVHHVEQLHRDWGRGGEGRGGEERKEMGERRGMALKSHFPVGISYQALCSNN